MSIKVNKYITPLLARDCCRGRDRRRTDGFHSRSSVLQRERLENRLPVSRQRTDHRPRPRFSFTPTETRPCCSSTTELVRGTRVPHPRRWHRTSAARAWRRWSHKSWMRKRLYRVLAG